MQIDDDDNEDLSALDRGDNPVAAKEDEKVIDLKRDEDGKFAKKEADDVKVDEVVVDEVEVDDVKTEAKEGEEEDDDEDDGKKDNLTIRLNKAKKQRDAAAARAEAAEARLAALEARSVKEEPKADPVKVINDELDALYEQVEELRADGKAKDAAKVQRQIDEKNREINKLESAKIASVTTSTAQLNAQYDAMVDVLEASYPELVKGTEEYDPETVRDLEFQVSAYEKMGMTSPAALRRAVKLLFREDPFLPGGRKKAEAEKVEEPEKKPEPKKTDFKKAAESSKKQPPDTTGRGVNKDEQKLDASKLSDEEWDALPETKRREMRGDFAI